ncbi:MAG: hypothetical protein LBD22_07260 [Spirochaetaceae bacterium]|jgi:hypothetical protein|nr:hypothetical protein [Spirochaetaceae bacterium]
MRKVLALLIFALVGSGFVMAQSALTVTKENVTIEYDAAKKVVRLTNGNADPYTVDYTIDGKGEKGIVLGKSTVWEQDAKAPPKAVDLQNVKKGGVVGKMGKQWKAGDKPAAPAAAPAKGAAPKKQ